MNKSLLMALMATGMVLNANAYENNAYVQTTQGGFVTLDEVSASYLKDANALNDLQPITATEGQELGNLFQWDSENGCLISSVKTSTEGAYIKLPVNSGQKYILSFKICQPTATAPYTSNIAYKSADGVITYNANGSSISKGDGCNVINVVGTNGEYNTADGFVSVGHDLVLSADWQTVDFVIDAEANSCNNWYFILQGINTTVQIKDVELQLVEERADLKKAAAYAKVAKEYLAAFDFDKTQDMTDLKEVVTNAITEINGFTLETDKSAYDEQIEALNSQLIPGQGAEGCLIDNVDDFLSSCTAKTNFKNLSALQKQSSVGDWTFYQIKDGVESVLSRAFPKGWSEIGSKTDKTLANDGSTAMGHVEFGHYQQGNSTLGTDAKNSCMKMTQNLLPGKYVFAIDGESCTRYPTGKGNWDACTSLSPADMKLFIKSAAGDTLATSEWIHMPGTEYATGLVAFTVQEQGDYTIGVDVNWVSNNGYYEAKTYGGAYFFRDPRVLCQLEGYTSAQNAYIAKVKEQVTAMRDSYDKANTLLAANDANQPWLRKELQAKVDEMKPILEAYEAAVASDANIINGFEDPVSGTTGGWAEYGGENMTYDDDGNLVASYNAADSIMNNGVRPMQYAVNDFKNANTPFTTIDEAMANAEKTIAMPIYSTCTGAADLKTAISTAKSAKETAAASEIVIPEATEEVTSPTYKDSEQYTALVNAISTLNEAVETFKTTIPAENLSTLADVQLEGKSAVYNETDGDYDVDCENGTLLHLSNLTTSNDNNSEVYMQLGYADNGAITHGELLRVGNGNAYFTFNTEAKSQGDNIDPNKARGAVTVDFDLYNVRLSGKGTGVSLMAAEETATKGSSATSRIKGFFYNAYDSSESLGDFANLTWGVSMMPGLAGDGINAISDTYKTHYQYLIDYTQNTITLTTTSTKGTQSETVAFDGTTVGKVYIESDVASFAVRRSWIGGIKVQQIKVADNLTGINAIQSVEEAAQSEKAVKVISNGQIQIVKGGHTYNAAGQLIK